MKWVKKFLEIQKQQLGRLGQPKSNQGNVLGAAPVHVLQGPVLFLINVACWPCVVKLVIKLFADDAC